jgi:hypothetical protein
MFISQVTMAARDEVRAATATCPRASHIATALSAYAREKRGGRSGPGTKLSGTDSTGDGSGETMGGATTTDRGVAGKATPTQQDAHAEHLAKSVRSAASASATPTLTGV